MKNGTASNTKLSIPRAICWAKISPGSMSPHQMNTNAVSDNTKAMGTPIAKVNTNATAIASDTDGSVSGDSASQPIQSADAATANPTAMAMSMTRHANSRSSANITMVTAARTSGAKNSSCGKPAPTVWPAVSASKTQPFQLSAPAAMTISIATIASLRSFKRGASRSTKNVTPALSPRANAAAAPRNVTASNSMRATSSAHTNGASSRCRTTTEPATTARSATSSKAAVISTIANSQPRLACQGVRGAAIAAQALAVWRMASSNGLADGVFSTKRSHIGLTRSRNTLRSQSDTVTPLAFNPSIASSSIAAARWK